MATIADLLNKFGQGINTFGQGLGPALDNPTTQLGLQMMMAGGPQAQQMSGGQRIGQALGGFMDMRQATTQRQAQEAAAQREKAVREALQQQAMQDPNFAASNPIARSVILAGGYDSGALKDVAGYGTSAAKPAALPGMRSVRNPDGTITEEFLNLSTMQYEKGNTYTPPDIINAATGQRRAAVAEAGVPIAQQRADASTKQADTAATQADTAQGRLKLQQQEFAVANAKAARERNLNKVQIESAYRTTDSRIDDSIKLIDNLLTNKGLAGNFGVYGAFPNWPEGAAAGAKAQVDKLVQRSGFTEMQDLTAAGVKLYPTSNVDLAAVQQSAGNLTKAQSYKDVKAELEGMKARLERARAEGKTVFDATMPLFEQPAPQQPAQPGVQPGGQPGPTTPQTQADFDALPPGSLYIDPDDGRTYRK